MGLIYSQIIQSTTTVSLNLNQVSMKYLNTTPKEIHSLHKSISSQKYFRFPPFFNTQQTPLLVLCIIENCLQRAFI